MKLSVLVPVYNEENTVADLLNKLIEIGSSPLIDSLEIIAVDDCSKDNSLKILQKYADDGKVKLLRHEKNQGKGAAVRTAISAVTGDYAVFQDADLEYDPQDLLRMAEFVINKNAAVLYGSRFLGKSTSPLGKFHYTVNAWLTTFSNLFTGLSLTDMETCYKMFRSDILKEIRLEEDRFGLEPEITAKAAVLAEKMNFEIYEIPISYVPRKRDEGKKIGVKDGIRALYIILKYGLF